MTEDKSNDIFTFPKWTDVLRPGIALAAVGGLVYASVIIYLGFSPRATDVGYMPTQPVPYSHALHVGQLGMDCRYCHTGVEQTARAGDPTHPDLHELPLQGSGQLGEADPGEGELRHRDAGAVDQSPRPAGLRLL